MSIELPAVERFDGTDEDWDRALGDMPGRTFCHQSVWSRIIRDGLGHEPIRLVARGSDGSIEGLLPLVLMKSLLFGTNLISVPFLNYGGPLGTVAARSALTRRAVEVAKDSRARLLELRSREQLDVDLPASLGKVTVLLPLPDDSEVLWKDLKAKVRSQVRRPMKAGMTSAFGPEYMPAFYEVFCRNMRDLGTPVLPRRFFETIARESDDQLIVAVVHREDEVVAAGVGFLYEGEFELTWASSAREYSREAPNMLLYWSLMEEVIRREGHTFNFGRCTPGGGTHRFKLQWGSEDQQLYWHRWQADGSPEDTGDDEDADGGLMSSATRIWQRLPLPVTNVLGPMVAPSIPKW